MLKVYHEYFTTFRKLNIKNLRYDIIRIRQDEFEWGEVMRKTRVSLDLCEEGMQIASPVYNEYGAVIVAENTIMDTNIIERLRALGLKSLVVYTMSNVPDVSNTLEASKAR